jgi:uncharacterized membrane protein (Fun14 family)
MKKWLRPKAYHSVVLIMIMGLCSIGFAWLTYGLIKVAMANVEHLTMAGLMGVTDGGLVMLIFTGIKAAFALMFYLGFKGIEHELLIRWNGHSH